MMNKALIAIGLFLGITITACSPKLTETVPVVAEEPAPAPIMMTMSNEASMGQGIFNTSCTKCHDAQIVDNFSREKWSKILPKMIEMAEINEEEANQVRAYVNWELDN